MKIANLIKFPFIFFLSHSLQAMKAFIEANFKIMDINSDGVIGLEEFRYNCIQRLATDNIKIVDDAFNALLNVSYFPPKNTRKIHT